MAAVDVLVPTRNRTESLVMTLSGLATQSETDLRVIVADQSDDPSEHSPVVRALFRVIAARGGTTEYHHRTVLYGIAEQRDFLLRRATAPAVLYVDDDVLVESWVVAQLLDTLRAARCGFVGAFPTGLSHLDDVRPDQQRVEFWDGPVLPEVVEPDSREWDRWQLHRAANLFHAGRELRSGEVRLYKVAWTGACVLYDREKLLAVGGFSFWPRLPRYHSGEEVLAQNLLMRRWGGCAMIPSGTYFSEVPTTVLNPARTVDAHALDLLPDMIARYAPPHAAAYDHPRALTHRHDVPSVP